MGPRFDETFETLLLDADVTSTTVWAVEFAITIAAFDGLVTEPNVLARGTLCATVYALEAVVGVASKAARTTVIPCERTFTKRTLTMILLDA